MEAKSLVLIAKMIDFNQISTKYDQNKPENRDNASLGVWRDGNMGLFTYRWTYDAADLLRSTFDEREVCPYG